MRAARVPQRVDLPESSCGLIKIANLKLPRASTDALLNLLDLILNKLILPPTLNRVPRGARDRFKLFIRSSQI
jgi:hypothetical protein